MKQATDKNICSMSELKSMGYPGLNTLANSEDFSEFGLGFRLTSARNSKVFFYKDRLDKYIERMTDRKKGILD